MTFLRAIRSAKVAPSGAVTAMRPSRMPVQTPTAVTPPTPYAQTVTAVAYAQSPIIDPVRAIWTRRSPGFRKTEAIEEPVSRTEDTTMPAKPLEGVTPSPAVSLGSVTVMSNPQWATQNGPQVPTIGQFTVPRERICRIGSATLS